MTSQQNTVNETYRALAVPVTGGATCTWASGSPPTPTGTVLAIHGITANHLSWPFLAAALPDYRIVAPDLRGRAGSCGLPGPYGMEQHVKDLVAVLDHLGGLDRVDVVGHSMGAFVAVAFHQLQPERVNKLILVDGGIPLQMPEGVDPQAALNATLGPAADRLKMTFDSVQAYRNWFKQHPAFTTWTKQVEDYVDYDLTGTPPLLRPSTSIEAMTGGDSIDMLGSQLLLDGGVQNLGHATWLVAERGMFDQPDGLYPKDYLEQWRPQLEGVRIIFVPRAQPLHDRVEPRGSATIADAVRTAEPA